MKMLGQGSSPIMIPLIVISLGVGFQESNIWLIIVGVVFFIIMTIILRYQVRKVYKK